MSVAGPSPVISRELDVVGRAVQALGDGASVRVSREALKGLESVEPFLQVVEAQTAAAEFRATYARGAGDQAERRAREVEDALENAADAEAARFRQIGEAIADLGAEELDLDVDDAVGRLGIDGPTTSGREFEQYMRDPSKALVLGPSADVGASAAERLRALARPTDSPPLGPVETDALLHRLGNPNRLSNDPTCGVCLSHDDKCFISAGDGMLLGLDGQGQLERSDVDLGNAQQTEAFRWLTGTPPVLEQHAVAALATELFRRNTTVSVGPNELGPFLMMGARLPVRGSRAPGIRDLAALLRDLKAAGAERGPLAAATLRLGFELVRVTFYERGGTLRERALAQSPVIDIGRIRWCTLSATASVWLPIFPSDPDTVGGADRPWTIDVPAAGATWYSLPQALRMDPDWFARIVVVPGWPDLLVLAPDSSWWRVEASYEAIVESRREHVNAWLRALESLELEAPKRIKALSELGKDAQVREGSGTRDEQRPAADRFSRAWVLERVQRYAFQDDTAARAVGARAVARGWCERAEFLTVVEWKSPRTRSRAEANSAERIKLSTQTAFATEDELLRLSTLLSLAGVGVPVASALLHFAWPNDYPILDYRALASLGDKPRRTQYSPEFWLAYLERCRKLATDAGVTIRDLDKALWQDSKEREVG